MLYYFLKEYFEKFQQREQKFKRPKSRTFCSAWTSYLNLSTEIFFNAVLYYAYFHIQEWIFLPLNEVHKCYLSGIVIKNLRLNFEWLCSICHSAFQLSCWKQKRMVKWNLMKNLFKLFCYHVKKQNIHWFLLFSAASFANIIAGRYNRNILLFFDKYSYFDDLFNKIHIFYHASLKMFSYPYALAAFLIGVFSEMKYCP